MTFFPRNDSQACVTISAFEGGRLTLPERFFVHPASPTAALTVPSLAFLITHYSPPLPHSTLRLDASGSTPQRPFRLLFDLGMRARYSTYLPPQQRHLSTRAPYALGPGVAASLPRGGLTAADVAFVLLSHVHYDHHGDPDDFPAPTTFAVGHGALNVLAHGLGGVASHQHFDPDLLPPDRTVELPDPRAAASEWRPLGPLPAVLDLFGDGSVYVVDAPGHLPGHVNLLCRVAVAPERWVYLAGDAAHDVRLLTGERAVGTWENERGQEMCIHLDRGGAEETIARIRRLVDVAREDGIEVEVVIAHDPAWVERNGHRMFPGTW